jgi:hypothetical protein
MRRLLAAALPVSAALVLAMPSAASAAFPGVNGPISYVMPDPMADLAYLGLLSPSGAPLPAWARGWRGSEMAERFSPELRRVAAGFVGRRNAIGVATAPSRRFRPVTRLGRGVGYDASPEWSPDGRFIVFERALFAHPGWFVATVSLDTGRVRRLAHGESPVWSMLGRIAFVRYFGHRAGIWTMDTSGGDRRRITFARREGQPDFSPDGTQIVFSRDDGNIYKVAADGGLPVRLTDAGHDATRGGYFDAAFSPDGKLIAYRTGARKIRVIGADGGPVLAEYKCVESCLGLDWLPAPQAPQ